VAAATRTPRSSPDHSTFVIFAVFCADSPFRRTDRKLYTEDLKGHKGSEWKVGLSLLSRACRYGRRNPDTAILA
jgi:hypothetical protein